MELEVKNENDLEEIKIETISFEDSNEHATNNQTVIEKNILIEEEVKRDKRLWNFTAAVKLSQLPQNRDNFLNQEISDGTLKVKREIDFNSEEIYDFLTPIKDENISSASSPASDEDSSYSDSLPLIDLVKKKKLKMKSKPAFPARPCIFCAGGLKTYSNLKVHILRHHRDNEEVKKAFEYLKNKSHPDFQKRRKDALEIIHNIRKRGIYNYNEIMISIGMKQIPLKRNHDHVAKVQCIGCDAMVSKSTFHRHRSKCVKLTENQKVRGRGLKDVQLTEIVENMEYELDPQFVSQCVKTLKPDKEKVDERLRVKNVIIMSQELLQIGSYVYCLLRANETKDRNNENVKRQTSTVMRSLARLIVTIRKNTSNFEFDVDDLYVKSNWASVRAALMELVKKEPVEVNDRELMKIGSCKYFDFAFKKGHEGLLQYYEIMDKNEKVKRLEDYKSFMNIQIKIALRLPTENDTIVANSKRRKEGNFNLDEAKSLSEFVDKEKREAMMRNPEGSREYTHIRRLAFTGILLSNRNRPRDLCEMTIEQYVDAKENRNAWENRKEELDKYGLSEVLDWIVVKINDENELTSCTFYIHKDYWAAIEVLCNPELRKLAAVIPENPLVFAGTCAKSMSSTVRYDTMSVCEKANIQSDFADYNYLQGLATGFAELGIPQSAFAQLLRNASLSHSTNKGNYADLETLRSLTNLIPNLVRIHKRYIASQEKGNNNFTVTKESVKVDSPNLTEDIDEEADSSDCEDIEDTGDRRLLKNKRDDPMLEKLRKLLSSARGKNKAINWSRYENSLWSEFDSFIKSETNSFPGEKVDEFLRKNPTFLRGFCGQNVKLKKEKLRYKLHNMRSRERRTF